MARDVNDLCSARSLQQGEAPIGTAPNDEKYILVECKTPWARIVIDSKDCPPGMGEVLLQARQDNVKVRLLAVVPDPEYSRKGETRVIFLNRGTRFQSRYYKEEYVLPIDKVARLAGSFLSNRSKMDDFIDYKRDTSSLRDILVCTHGSRDVCCGKFGYPIYKALRTAFAEDLRENLRVWRCSHIVGDRFAPNIIDFPEGRYYGHLEIASLETLIKRIEPVSSIIRCYRGWGCLSSLEQVAEREIFVQEGWDWIDYQKSVAILELNQSQGWAKVRIDFAATEGSTSGAYEMTVEKFGTVQPARCMNAEAMVEYQRHRVSHLVKVV